MKLIVDSGSTKTDWIAINDKGEILFQTSIVVRDSSSVQYILDDLSGCIDEFFVAVTLDFMPDGGTTQNWNNTIGRSGSLRQCLWNKDSNY